MELIGTEVNDLNTPRNNLAGAAADNTLGLAFGGYSGSPPHFAGLTESWNGSKLD